MSETLSVVVLRLAIKALADRALSMMALLMTFGLACWAMYEPSYERDAIAAFFAVAVFLPCTMRDRRKDDLVQAQG